MSYLKRFFLLHFKIYKLSIFNSCILTSNTDPGRKPREHERGEEEEEEDWGVTFCGKVDILAPSAHPWLPTRTSSHAQTRGTWSEPLSEQHTTFLVAPPNPNLAHFTKHEAVIYSFLSLRVTSSFWVYKYGGTWLFLTARTLEQITWPL